MERQKRKKNITEKYTNIEFDDQRQTFAEYQNIKPEDIILLSCWTDIYWNHKSEYEGEFLGLIYLKDEVPRAQCFNLADKEPTIDFIKKSKDVLVYHKGRAWCQTFYNKNMLKNLSSKNGVLIYKDQFKIKSDYDDLYFSVPKSFELNKFKPADEAKGLI